MLNSILPITVGALMIILTIAGDILIKNASLGHSFSGWKSLLVGSIFYALTGVGWFFVMRNMKLSTLGVFYGVGCILLLTLFSVFLYKENINIIEIIGIILGIISLIILFRFG
jgi:multidrug transporter EmrE-like cation transporter